MSENFVIVESWAQVQISMLVVIMVFTAAMAGLIFASKRFFIQYEHITRIAIALNIGIIAIPLAMLFFMDNNYEAKTDGLSAENKAKISTLNEDELKRLVDLVHHDEVKSYFYMGTVIGYQKTNHSLTHQDHLYSLGELSNQEEEENND